MILKPLHHGLPFANQKLEWWSPDTESRFNELMAVPEYSEYFTQRGWHQPGAITYEFNSEGFRSPEFDSDQPTVMVLGCSYTMGIGLPVQDTWPTMLASTLQMKLANFGWGGASGDYCYRMAEYWIPKLNPQLVVLLNPPESRMEITVDSQGRTDEVSAVIVEQSQWSQDRWIQQWYANEENLQRHQRKNHAAIAGLARSNNVSFLGYTAHDWMARSREELGYARDRYHAGRPGHEKLVEQIIDDWRKIKKS